MKGGGAVTEFEQIYTRHYPFIYRFLYKLCSADDDLASELAQETFYQAFLSFHRFRGDCEITTWLCKIAKNCFCQEMRSRRRACLCFDGALCQLHDESIGPELVAEHRETFETIVACIQSMKSRYRDILLYRLFSELSYAQIAAIMHMGEGAAKVLYHRARLQLQTLIMEVLSP